MNINIVNIDTLVPAEYNPRVELKPGMPEYEKLKNSIQEFGYVEPVIVNDRTGKIVGGHQRINVLKDLGYKEIEVVHVDLDEAHEKALNIALNKISGSWDAEKLEDLLRDINLETDLDIKFTGFDESELDTLFNGSDNKNKYDKKNYNRDPDVINDLCKEAKESITNHRKIKLGDRFKLGNHILLCGDSFKKETFDSLLDGQTCNLVFTDPPYNYGQEKGMDLYRSFDGIDSANNVLKTAMDKGFLSWDVYSIEYLFKNKIPNMYFCCNRNDLHTYIELGVKYKYKWDIHVLFKRNCVPAHTSAYLNDIEYVLFFRQSGATFNGKLPGIYYRHLVEDPDNEETVEKQFYSKVCFTISSEGRKESEIELKHPTIKPLRLIIPRIAISSNENDIVVDMFCGSGSTLIACEKLNRRCYAVEMDPEYMNETIDRWEAYTGKKAVKL